MTLPVRCLLAAALALFSSFAHAASGPPGSCIRVDPAYSRVAAATGGQVLRVRPEEMAALQPFTTAQMVGDLATVERRRIDLGRQGKARVDIPVDAGATRLLVSVSMTGDCAPSVQHLRLLRPNGLPLIATGMGVKIAEYAMGKLFLVEAPEAGTWTLEAEGSGPTDLVAQVRSPLAFHRFEFVRPNGDIHGGFSKIPGSPVVGAKALGAATLFGGVRSVRFRLVDDAGRALGGLSLATDYPMANPYNYMGDVTLPSVPFRIEASGVDAKGRAFQRVYAVQFEAQPVSVQTKDGFTVVEARPGTSKTFTFTVRNVGASGTFRFMATEGAGWARGAQPASAMLAHDQSIEVRVPLKVPRDSAPGDDHSIVFTATRQDNDTVYNSAVVQVIVLGKDEPEALRY